MQAERLTLSGVALRLSFHRGTTESPLDMGRASTFEARCVVDDDPGDVVRGARPITAEDLDRMREQGIARLLARHLFDTPARATARQVQDRVAQPWPAGA